MKMLVFQRLLVPASKKKTFENKDYFFENCKFSLDDVYRCLTFFNSRKNAMLLWLHENIQKLYGRDTSLVYYDVTNYYFEIEGPEGFLKIKKDDPNPIPDGFRKKGVSKEHRPDPIVQMGLFMDNNSIPITYQLFPGNTNDCLTYRPNLSQIKRQFGLGRAVVVADKAMCTGDNIWYTLSAKDGYVFSLSVRGASKELIRYVLDEKGYEWVGNEYKKKSRLEPRIIHVSKESGGKMDKTVHEKQVVFYSEKYDKRAKAERAAVIAKATDLINDPAKYNRATSYGAASYVKNIKFDKKTGEVLDSGQALMLNREKIREEEALDGYYMIVTSEHKESDDRIIEMYRGLWKIEESFRVIKSDLEARPVYVSTREHIEAHFLTCFISLVIARILEMKTDRKYSIGKMLESLGKAECTHLQQNYYLFDYYDETLKDVGNSFGIDFSKRVRSMAEIKNILASTKK
jgi:transposase